MTKQAQCQKLINKILGDQAVWILHIGLKAGLFKAIAEVEGGLSECALAYKLGFAPRYVSVWCRAAYAFKLLDWDEQSGYRLAQHMESLLLNPTDPQYVGGRLEFFIALHEDFLAFPELLRTGEVLPHSSRNQHLLESIKDMTKSDPRMITDIVLPQAGDTLARLEQGGTILDIGAGAGFALVHYARRFPNSWVTGMEFDSASVRLGRRTVAEEGLGDRVEIRHGDANLLDDDSIYDLVTMNVALHEMGGPAEFRNVLSRVRRALKQGATALVSELPYPDSVSDYRNRPGYQALAGLQVHEALVGCGMITQGELRELLEGTGFSNVRVADQPVHTRFVMLGERTRQV